MYKNFNSKTNIIMFIVTLFCLQHGKIPACEYCIEETPSTIRSNKAYNEKSQSHNPYQQPPCYSYGKFSYIKLGGSISSLDGSDEFNPAIGIGKRIELGDSAVDISVNYGGDEWEYQYSFPKMMYIHYLMPEERQSPYFGAGLSWGAIRSYKGKFEGIIGEIALGYELQRMSPLCTFVELDISQGLFSTRKRGKTNGPAIMLTGGVGY